MEIVESVLVVGVGVAWRSNKCKFRRRPVIRVVVEWGWVHGIDVAGAVFASVDRRDVRVETVLADGEIPLWLLLRTVVIGDSPVRHSPR